MKELPDEALTLISRARVLEKLIKDAMVDVPARATLGELLGLNSTLFEGYRDRVQWAGRIRNGCAHVTDEDFSIVEIKKAIEILDAAIAEMTGTTVEVIADSAVPDKRPEAPYVFTNSFYINISLLALLAGTILLILMRI